MQAPTRKIDIAGNNSGLYQLLIRLDEKRVIRVGRHGRFSFPAGCYVYTGSARRGLESRIARHLRRGKRLRWHVDYLLQYGRVLGVKRYSIRDQSECELSGRVEKLPGSVVVVPHFGSSDCRCYTHLFYFQRNLARELGDGAGEYFAKVSGPSPSGLVGSSRTPALHVVVHATSINVHDKTLI